MPAPEPKDCHLGLDVGLDLESFPSQYHRSAWKAGEGAGCFPRRAMYPGRQFSSLWDKPTQKPLLVGFGETLFQGAPSPLFLHWGCHLLPCV